MTNYAKNILNTFDLATLDEVNHGLTWYHDVKAACQHAKQLYVRRLCRGHKPLYL